MNGQNHPLLQILTFLFLTAFLALACNLPGGLGDSPEEVIVALITNTPTESETEQEQPGETKTFFEESTETGAIESTDKTSELEDTLIHPNDLTPTKEAVTPPDDDDNSPPTLESNKDKLVFMSKRDRKSELYTMMADGSEVTRLTETEDMEESMPAWSTDRKKIAYCDLKLDKGLSDIWVMNSDGSGKTQLTDISMSPSFLPNWSPDGKKILFVSDLDGAPEMFIMDADGRSQKQFLNKATGFGGDWSADGKSIVFVSDQTGNHEIYSMKADGSNIKKLTESVEKELRPLWSPDGQSIIYIYGSGDQEEIYMMKADGSEAHSLSLEPSNIDSLTWSPDGQLIAYSSSIEGKFQIYILDIKGENNTNITGDLTKSEGQVAWAP